MFLQNKKYIKEILFIIPFKTGKIYTYRNTVYQYISDSKHGVRTNNTRMLLYKTSGCCEGKEVYFCIVRLCIIDYYIYRIIID